MDVLHKHPRTKPGDGTGGALDFPLEPFAPQCDTHLMAEVSLWERCSICAVC